MTLKGAVRVIGNGLCISKFVLIIQKPTNFNDEFANSKIYSQAQVTPQKFLGYFNLGRALERVPFALGHLLSLLHLNSPRRLAS